MSSTTTLLRAAPLVLVLMLGLVAGCDQASGSTGTAPSSTQKSAPTGDELEHTGKPGENKPAT